MSDHVEDAPAAAAIPLPPASPAAAERPAGRRRTLFLILLLVAGLAGLGGGGTALFAELTRPPTKAEVAAAGQAEVATRWQRLTAGQIFPPAIRYDVAVGVSTVAQRVGIAPPSACSAALDPQLVQLFRRQGCLVVLRATYLDQSGTVAATIAIAVMRTPAGAQAAENLMPSNPGPLAARFPGTRAALFGDAQRVPALLPQSQGPYVFLAAAGDTDGRPGADVLTRVPVDMGSAIITRELAILTGGPRPCSRQDVQC